MSTLWVHFEDCTYLAKNKMMCGSALEAHLLIVDELKQQGIPAHFNNLVQGLRNVTVGLFPLSLALQANT